MLLLALENSLNAFLGKKKVCRGWRGTLCFIQEVGETTVTTPPVVANDTKEVGGGD